MAQIPNVILNGTSVHSEVLTDSGDLCNAYQPLQNLSSSQGILGDFTTDKLNFDLEHPVDILPQYSYDGAVNLILNDGKNSPRLINSRFTVLNDTKYKIPDHYGFRDTNIYDEDTFDIDANLKPIPLKIPKVVYEGLEENSGNLKCGAYTFFFKLCDADGNETEVVAESGMVYIHIGHLNDPNSIRMGMEDENTNKSIKFSLSNLDSGFDFVRVLYARDSSGNDMMGQTNYAKVMFDYPIWDQKCDIVITGNEVTIGASAQEIYTDFADITAVKTLELHNNILLLGNCVKPEHDWDALRRASWKIIPTFGLEDNIGNINSAYALNTEIDPDSNFCYYNTKNLYYRVGYWPDELYRFGVVYIFEDNSLSPVFNILGVDFNKLNCSDLDYELMFFLNDGSEHEYEPDDYIFNKKYLLNSRGVIKFRKDSFIFSRTNSGLMQPYPLYIKFDLRQISKKAFDSAELPEVFFKEHKIKGLFFVRLTRIPTILGLGVMIGLSDKDRGALPVIQNANRYTIQSFLTKLDVGEGKDPARILLDEAVDFSIEDKDQFSVLAMLVPEAEMCEATYNQLFVSNEFTLEEVAKYKFDFSEVTHSGNFLRYYPSIGTLYKAKLLNVTEDTKIATNGVDYFSTMAGMPSEPYKTSDIEKRWRWSLPLDLTLSTTLVRGKWGPYVGVSKPINSDEVPYSYGQVFNIKLANYYENEETATELDFQRRFTTVDVYHAISDRFDTSDLIHKCYRGDCYTSMFTHRMFRNFIDPELPTNTLIVNPSCWDENYGVRCTAEILKRTHSNLTEDSAGWVIPSENSSNLDVALLVTYLLTFNFIGAGLLFKKDNNQSYYKDIEEDYKKAKEQVYYALGIQSKSLTSADTNMYVLENGTIVTNVDDQDQNWEYANSWVYKIELQNSITEDLQIFVTSNLGLPCQSDIIEPAGSTIVFPNTNYQESEWYKYTSPNTNVDYFIKFEKLDNWNKWGDDISDEIKEDYPYGMANEIVPAFETYIPDLSLKWVSRKKKKLDPKELEQSSAVGALNLKAIFKSDDHWKLRGISGINRADVNAVGLGQWITFPICSAHNLSMRDVDFTNATEEASFARKRSFYPLHKKIMQDPLRDSNVLNKATGISIPEKGYLQMPDVPFIKQEYFNRIYNSLMDSTESITNELKVIFENAYKDYTKRYGSITKLVSFNNNVYIIFKHGIGILLLIPAAAEVKSFLPECQMITDIYGSIWKDSIIKTDRAIYGVDSVSKAIWCVSSSGQLSLISPMKVEKFLIDNLDMSEFTISPYIGHINIKSHYNAFKRDVIFTYYNDVPLDSDGNRLYLLGDNSKEALELTSKISCWVPGKQWSLCWQEDILQFTTFYDWIPLESANIDNIHFSFDKDAANELNCSKNLDLQASVFNIDRSTGNISASTLTAYENRNSLKILIDPAFTNKCTITSIKSLYGSNSGLILFVGSCQNPDKYYAISFYYRYTDLILPNNAIKYYLKNNLSSVNNLYLILNTRRDIGGLYKNSLPISSDWKFYTILLKSNKNLSDYSLIFDNNSLISYQIADVHFRELEDDSSVLKYYKTRILESQEMDSAKTTTYYIVTDDVNSLTSKTLYELRDSSNSLKLWKHGQAGIYDNQGKIKPTHWYGKLHEFNFEFIARELATHKIFNNLKMISNKAEPMKFEFEVVGEVYDWYEYKAVVQWINNHVGTRTFDLLYLEVLTTPYNTLLSRYQDFPELFGRDQNYIIKKLPYLRIELSDRKGTKDLDIYNLKDPKLDSYKDNTSEAILVYDEQLNEYRVHTEQLGNNMKKYGRLRGNMEYLEDLWDIEIRPVSFIYAYSENNILKFTKPQETRLRDKYIKIKVRYSGKDLAVISAIATMFNYSFA